MLKHLATLVCFCFVGRFPVPTGLAIRCSCCSVAGEVASPQTARSAWPLRKPIRTRSTMTWCRRRHTFHGEDGRSGGKASEAQMYQFPLYLRGGSFKDRVYMDVYQLKQCSGQNWKKDEQNMNDNSAEDDWNLFIQSSGEGRTVPKFKKLFEKLFVKAMEREI